MHELVKVMRRSGFSKCYIYYFIFYVFDGGEWRLCGCLKVKSVNSFVKKKNIPLYIWSRFICSYISIPQNSQLTRFVCYWFQVMASFHVNSDDQLGLEFDSTYYIPTALLFPILKKKKHHFYSTKSAITDNSLICLNLVSGT